MRNRGCFFGIAAVLGMLVAWFVLRPGEVPTAKQVGGEMMVQATPRPMPGAWLSPAPTPFPATAAASVAAPALPRPVTGTALKPAAVASRIPAAATTAGPSPRPPDAAMTEALKVHRMIVDYNTLMGENPVGTNAEIMRAMMGGNPHQAQFGPPEGQTLNSKGELVDPWGTPYFFHQLSRDHMEIHSAGPDRIMGTADDVVIP